MPSLLDNTEERIAYCKYLKYAHANEMLGTDESYKNTGRIICTRHSDHRDINLIQHLLAEICEK